MSPRKRVKLKSWAVEQISNKSHRNEISNKSGNGSNISGTGSDVQQLSNDLVLKYLEEKGFREIHDQFLQVISKQSGKYTQPSMYNLKVFSLKRLDIKRYKDMLHVGLLKNKYSHSFGCLILSNVTDNLRPICEMSYFKAINIQV